MNFAWLPVAIACALSTLPAAAATLSAASFSGVPSLTSTTGTLSNAVAILGPAVDGPAVDLIGATLLSADVAALASTPGGIPGLATAGLLTFGDLLLDNRGNLSRLDVELTLRFDLRANGTGLVYDSRAFVGFTLGLGDDPAGPLSPSVDVSDEVIELRIGGAVGGVDDIEDFSRVFVLSVPAGQVAVGVLSASVSANAANGGTSVANTDARLILTSARLVAPEPPVAVVPLPATATLLAAALATLVLRRRTAAR